MKVTLRNRAYIPGRKVLEPGVHDLTAEELKGLGMEVPKQTTKKKVAAKTEPMEGGDE